jgi:large subunit ribosomal protein L10
MPSLHNQQQFEDIKARIAQSKAVIITNYAGLSVADQVSLRQALTAAGGQFMVTKNNLVRIALSEVANEVPGKTSAEFTGQTGTLFCLEDPITPTKALIKFIKDHDLPVVKLGMIDGKVITATEVENLSKLPGRIELLGMLAGQLNAPISAFAQVLRANLQNLVFAVDAIKRQKQA